MKLYAKRNDKERVTSSIDVSGFRFSPPEPTTFATLDELGDSLERAALGPWYTEEEVTAIFKEFGMEW